MRGGMGAMRCLPIMRNLSQGASGDDVTSLQQTLVDDGFLSASSTTGFFGPLTARAVMQMQVRFGIASSSTGFVGPLTRGFLRGGCGEGQGGAMGSSTSPAWLAGSSTHPMLNPFDGGSGDINQMMDGTSSGVHVMRPMMPVMGSSTMPLPPCMPNGAGASTTDDSGLGNSAAVAAAFFVPHVLIPGAMRPCSDVSGEMQQQ
jgi:peptidoglycan hydrolase-like protein with peptidoglycan-binding domain